MQRLRVIIGADRRALLAEGVAGVEAFVHFHDGDAGLALVVQDRPLNRRGAAVFRQKRGVNVQAAEARQFEDLSRQDLAVSGYHNQVGSKLRQFLKESFVAGAFGLEDGELFLRREDFHR